MLSAHEIESLRRSSAIAPLGKGDTDRLIGTVVAPLAERVQIAAVLDRLPDSWTEVRRALNELQKIVRRSAHREVGNYAGSVFGICEKPLDFFFVLGA